MIRAGIATVSVAVALNRGGRPAAVKSGREKL
jgi:hypothetical protein